MSNASEDNRFECPTSFAANRSLSYEARGLLWYLYSLESNHLNPSELEQGCGRDKLYSILEEIEAAGYLQRKQSRDGGALSSCEYVLYETPFAWKSETGPITGYVYLIQPQGFNVYKIGCTVDVDSRCAELQSKIAIPLRVIHSFPSRNHEAIERMLHRKFKRYHLDGDWFALPEWAVAEIKAIEEL